MLLPTIIGIGAATFVVLLMFAAMLFRTVVPTNAVHIVQSAKKTMSYGKDQDAGNTYYAWPSWIPRIGIRVIELPVSVFDVDLDAYAAYDKGRVPFVVDTMAFFRIHDSNKAAQRVHSFEELKDQLKGVLQGALRAILASSEIEEILEGRSKFGEMFTKEVDHNLVEWGVQSVKQIELMDIRDAQGSKVIENIMAKKKSLIEMQSRTEVADNNRKAQLAEIEATQNVKTREQEALQMVGIRTAEKEQAVGIAAEKSAQQIKEQAAVTMSKTMEVKRVEEVKQAEIKRDVQVVAADQTRQTNIIGAEGEKQQTIITAEGRLQQAKLNAEGIRVEGEAKGAAEQAVLMAPVNTQITLAKEIGENQGYQEYLIKVRVVEMEQVVGVAKAEALKEAELKVIANSGNVNDGITNLMDLFSSKGGTALGAMAEAFKQTPAGTAIVKKIIGNEEGTV